MFDIFLVAVFILVVTYNVCAEFSISKYEVVRKTESNRYSRIFASRRRAEKFMKQCSEMFPEDHIYISRIN